MGKIKENTTRVAEQNIANSIHDFFGIERETLPIKDQEGSHFLKGLAKGAAKTSQLEKKMTAYEMTQNHFSDILHEKCTDYEYDDLEY